MKKLNLIYNPKAGNNFFKYELSTCIEKFQEKGYIVTFFKIDFNNIEEYFKNLKKDEFDVFVISGGDGTINLIINLIMKYKLNHIPIGFIPSGTANDFASFLNLPKKVEDACDVINNNNIKTIDIGLANDKYFINVCAGGLFANIGQKINKDFKETFGKLSYYVKAIEEMAHSKPIKLRVTNSKEVIEDDFYLFLVLNSSGTGGIEKISPSASVSDGYFDFVGFRNVNFKKLPVLALKFLKREYLEDDGILFFKDKEILIENLSNKSIETDLDGEIGPNIPVKITNITQSIKIFCNDNL